MKQCTKVLIKKWHCWAAQSLELHHSTVKKSLYIRTYNTMSLIPPHPDGPLQAASYRLVSNFRTLLYFFQIIRPFYIWVFVENGQGMVWLHWHFCSSFVDGLTHNSWSPNRTAHHLCWVRFIHARTSLVRIFTYYHIAFILLYNMINNTTCPLCSTWCAQCKQWLDFNIF